MAEIKAPPSINLPALRPIEPNSVPEMTDKPTNGSSNGSLVTRKIKACPELPPGKTFYLHIYCFKMILLTLFLPPQGRINPYNIDHI